MLGNTKIYTKKPIEVDIHGIDQKLEVLIVDINENSQYLNVNVKLINGEVFSNLTKNILIFYIRKNLETLFKLISLERDFEIKIVD